MPSVSPRLSLKLMFSRSFLTLLYEKVTFLNSIWYGGSASSHSEHSAPSDISAPISAGVSSTSDILFALAAPFEYITKRRVTIISAFNIIVK